MTKEAAPPLGLGAGTASEGSLALASDEAADAKPRAPLPPLGNPALRSPLPTLEGLAPVPPVVRDFDDPTNPDEAEWELTSELRAKPLPSQSAAPTLPSANREALPSDMESVVPTVPKPQLDTDDDFDDSDLTSVFVRPEGSDDDEEWNDEETFIASPVTSDAAPTAPRALPPPVTGASGRSVPPPPPRSGRAAALSALGMLARPSAGLPPPPPLGGAARASALPPGLLGMTTRPAAAPPPPPPPGRPSALPPPTLTSRSALPPPPVAGGRSSSAPPPPLTTLRTAVPAPPAPLGPPGRSLAAPPPVGAPPKPAFPPPPGAVLPPPPRASAPPPAPLGALPSVVVPPPSRAPRASDRPPAVASPFAVESLRAPVARPSAPPAPPGSSIAPVAMARTTYPSASLLNKLPPRRIAWLAAAAFVGIGLLGIGAVMMTKPGSAAAGGSGKSVLTVTVAGEGNRPLGDLTVVANDVVRCTSSPCRISNLAAGTHFVRVTAEGYTATAARAVSVNEDGEAAMHFQLSRIVAPVALDTRQTETPAPSKPAEEKPAVDLDADREAASAAPVETRSPARDRSSRSTNTSRSDAKAPREERTPSKLQAAIAEEQPAARAVEEPTGGAMGTLNINSTPPANIVLDGRPLGKTPISGVKVSPGPHTIVFIGPDGKRKVGSTSIKPGASRTVGVKF